MKMNTALSFSIILPVLILFSIDPDTTLLADNTQKLNYRDIVVTDDMSNSPKVILAYSSETEN